MERTVGRRSGLGCWSGTSGGTNLVIRLSFWFGLFLVNFSVILFTRFVFGVVAAEASSPVRDLF
jgi:hypothetical protein